MFYKLTLITNKNDTPLNDYLPFVERCAASGLTAIQLREKTADYPSLLHMGRALKAITTAFGIALIINDNLELAMALDADGLHLGQSDGCLLKARERLGADKYLGVSIDSLSDLQRANDLPVDYIGVGALFPSGSKQNVATLWGLDGLRRLADVSRHPIIALGGIDEGNAMGVMQAGAHGLAAIAAFHSSADPAASTQNLRRIVDVGGKGHDC